MTSFGNNFRTLGNNLKPSQIPYVSGLSKNVELPKTIGGHVLNQTWKYQQFQNEIANQSHPVDLINAEKNRFFRQQGVLGNVNQNMVAQYQSNFANDRLKQQALNEYEPRLRKFRR